MEWFELTNGTGARYTFTDEGDLIIEIVIDTSAGMVDSFHFGSSCSTALRRIHDRSSQEFMDWIEELVLTRIYLSNLSIMSAKATVGAYSLVQRGNSGTADIVKRIPQAITEGAHRLRDDIFALSKDVFEEMEGSQG